ncbi:uncharacterized protein TNCV_1433941 [Trichonephila clavipes]|nr:uncharacterized protein TNCV_1433941 [Trichonephila clavipes]
MLIEHDLNTVKSTDYGFDTDNAENENGITQAAAPKGKSTEIFTTSPEPHDSKLQDEESGLFQVNVVLLLSPNYVEVFLILNHCLKKDNVWENKWKRFPQYARNGTWRRRSNLELYRSYKESDIVNFIKVQRIKCEGHIIRMNEDRTAEKVFNAHPIGTRRAGQISDGLMA